MQPFTNEGPFLCLYISDGQVYISHNNSRMTIVFSGVKEFRAASKPPGKTQMMKKNIVQA